MKRVVNLLVAYQGIALFFGASIEYAFTASVAVQAILLIKLRDKPEKKRNEISDLFE